MSVIRQLIKIRGTACVLIPDEVAEKPSSAEMILVQEATRHLPPIWVRDTDAEQARLAHPKARIYGFWQAMFASDLVDLKDGLAIYEEEGYSLFLEASGRKVVRTGHVVAGRLPYEVEVAMGDAVRLDLEAADLRQPKEATRLPSEIRAARKQRDQQTRFICGLGGAVVALACAGYQYTKHLEADRRQSTLDALAHDQSIRSQRLDDLRKYHVQDNPLAIEQRQALVYLLDLVSISETVDLAATGLLDQPRFDAQADGLLGNPKWADSITALQDGSYQVTYEGAGNAH